MLLTRRGLAPLLALAARGAARAAEGNMVAGWSTEDGPESSYYEKDGVIHATPAAEYPAWLRSAKQYENFDLSMDWFSKGWMDGGVYFSAPEHGVKSRCGFKVSLFHQLDKDPRTNSALSIFPVIAPRLVNVKPEWNALRIRMDWPKLQVWSNGAMVHDLDCEAHPELKYRLHRGYLGLESLSYPHRWRNIRIEELPAREKWEPLFTREADLARWTITEVNERAPAKFEAFGRILRSDGLGNLTTKEKYRDFALRMYIRGTHQHNGGVLFRSHGGRERYEIQLHDVREAHYPTGSLYFFQRAKYPEIESQQWFLLQMWVKDAWCLVRINGENVMEYGGLENLQPGFLELQAHQAGRWMEYKEIEVKRL